MIVINDNIYIDIFIDYYHTIILEQKINRKQYLIII